MFVLYLLLLCSNVKRSWYEHVFVELEILEFLSGIKLGTSDHLMLVSDYHRPLTCTRHSTESGKMTELCFQSEGSQCLSLCQETQTG